MPRRAHHRARDARPRQGSEQGLHAGAAGAHGGDHAACPATRHQDRHQHGCRQPDGRRPRGAQACRRLGLSRLHLRRGDWRRSHRGDARASRTAADGRRRAAGIAAAADGVGQRVSRRRRGGARLRHRRRIGDHRTRGRSGAVPGADAACVRLVVRRLSEARQWHACGTSDGVLRPAHRRLLCRSGQEGGRGSCGARLSAGRCLGGWTRGGVEDTRIRRASRCRHLHRAASVRDARSQCLHHARLRAGCIRRDVRAACQGSRGVARRARQTEDTELQGRGWLFRWLHGQWRDGLRRFQRVGAREAWYRGGEGTTAAARPDL